MIKRLQEMRSREKQGKQRNDFDVDANARGQQRQYESEPMKLASRKSEESAPREKSRGKRWEQLYELVDLDNPEQTAARNKGIHEKGSCR